MAGFPDLKKKTLLKNRLPSIHPTVPSRASLAVTFLSAKVPAAPGDLIKALQTSALVAVGLGLAENEPGSMTRNEQLDLITELK